MAVIRDGARAAIDVYSADVQAPTFGRVLRRIQGQASQLLRRLTDENATDFIDHSGGPQGKPLHMTLGAFQLDASVDSDDVTGAGGKLDGGAKLGDTAKFFWPIYVPPGTNAIAVEVSTTFFPSERRGRVTLWTLDGSSSVTVDLTTDLATYTGGDVVSVAPFIAVPDDAQYWCLVEFDQSYDETRPYIVRGVSVYAQAAAQLARPLIDDALVPTPRIRLRAPGGSESLRFREFDDTEIVDDQAIHGHMVSWIDSNLNAVEEWLTGLPAGGAQTYTATESALVNPTRDRFRASTRKTFLDEPFAKVPVLHHCFGAVRGTRGTFGATNLVVEDADPPTYGALNGWAPFPNDPSECDLARLPVVVPDAPTSVIALEVRVMLLIRAHALADYVVRVQLGSNTVASAAPTAVGAGNLCVATFSGVAFTRDTLQALRISTEYTGGGTLLFGDVSLLGVAAWLE